VAIDRTSIRSEGGKAPRPTWAQRILQTGQPVLKVPGAPEADGLAVTVHVSRHPEIRRSVWSSCTEDEATTKGQGLGGGMGTREGLQTLAFIVR
jgi:hypothetical protein